MAPYLPVTLTGGNLGKRHEHFNTLVNDAHKKNIPLSSIVDTPERHAVDKLFKIDLASKNKDVDYIINTLKDENMLYVSKALKTTWLLADEYNKIINPVHLEDVLYPDMTTTAVTKMKHWIEHNLKDSDRSEQFYQYYKDKEFNTAIKFLPKCSKEFIMNEVPNILDKMTPFRLKLLAEKCPDVAKIFFDSLQSNEAVIKSYNEEEKNYYKSLKFLLKVNTDMYLDITEKYFCRSFKRFSAESTKYVLRNRKDRFNKKPELYTAWLLDIKTLAKYLSEEEIKDTILKLARAEYLQGWFSYKNVEPMIKKLSVKERAAFKKKVFVDKDVGDMVKSWPYDTPASPEVKYTGASVFEDEMHDPDEYEYLRDPDSDDLRSAFRSCLTKRKYCAYMSADVCETMSGVMKRKTSFDQLFDRFRYASFEKALYELRKQLAAASAKQRQYIMLVLVSKSGGRDESVEQLLKLLTERHANEAENLRATVIRSLVKRSNAWRLPQGTWDLLLEFGRGVGLDGKPSTVACKEGLHAVVIRTILFKQEIDETIWEAYLQDFTSFNEYSLNPKEKQTISIKLPELLVARAEKRPNNATDLLEKALDTLNGYKVRIDKCPDLIAAIALAAKKGPNVESLLHRLYNARIARKELLRENFAIIQNEQSYLNALRHDPSILASGEDFEKIVKKAEIKHDKFLLKLALYFNEESGLAQKYFALLMKHVEESPKKELARSVAILSGDKLITLLSKHDDAPKKSETQRFAAALRANANVVTPLIDLEAFGWERIGAKTVSNRVLVCSRNSVHKNVQKLLASPKTQRTAFVLALRAGEDITKAFCEKRPRFTLKIVLWHARRNKLNDSIWDVIIPIISKLNTSGKLKQGRINEALSNVDAVPENKRVEYCLAVFNVFQSVSKYSAMPILCHLEHLLPEVKAEFFEDVIEKFLKEEFCLEKWENKNYSYDLCAYMRLRIIAKYLLFCKSETEQQRRWEKIGQPFFDQLGQWKESKLGELLPYLEEFMKSLKCTKLFLDKNYVDCLPNIEKIIKNLQNIFPLHQYYGIYINAHLTMLFFKSVRQSMKNNPTIFEDLPKNLEQGAEIVGRIFGKYIAHEVIELMTKQYDSMKYIYMKDLITYLRKNFMFGNSKMVLIANVVKGVLDCKNEKVHLLAEHVFNQEFDNFPKHLQDEVFKQLDESANLEVKIFLNQHMFTNCNFN